MVVCYQLCTIELRYNMCVLQQLCFQNMKLMRCTDIKKCSDLANLTLARTGGRDFVELVERQGLETVNRNLNLLHFDACPSELLWVTPSSIE